MIWPKCTVRGTKSASVFLNIMADITDLALKFNSFTNEINTSWKHTGVHEKRM